MGAGVTPLPGPWRRRAGVAPLLAVAAVAAAAGAGATAGCVPPASVTGPALIDGGLDRAADEETGRLDAPATRCSRLTALPLPFIHHPAPPRSEDFTFDNEGYLMLVAAGSLLRTSRDGPAMLLVPNVVPMPGTSPAARGLRMLAGGEVIIADALANTLVRVERSGSRRNLATIPSPNGIVIAPGGALYVSSLQLGIYRVDPATGDTTSVALLPGADGLTFSPDHRTLYATNVIAGGVYRMAVQPDGALGQPEIWVADVGREPDGMVTDACGNVYVTSFRDGDLRRIDPGGAVELAARFGDVRIPAVNFGSGRHGWAAGKLYVMNMSSGGVYELDPGVGAAPP